MTFLLPPFAGGFQFAVASGQNLLVPSVQFVVRRDVWTSPQMVDTQLRVYNHLGRSSNGKNATYLHPGVQSRSRQARHRARLLRRRGCTFSRTQSKPHPQLEASSPGAGPTRLSRSWQALSLGGGEPPTPGRE